MEKLSGLVLDVYDDPAGEVLREIFPTYAAVPDLIKEAHQLSFEEREQVPDHLFALVLLDGDTVMRKLACVDAGNTALAVEYFLKMAYKLPEEAQKVAAENLITACSWYDIDPPEELQKVALLGRMAVNYAKKNPLSAALTVLTAPSVIKGTAGQVRGGLQAAKASGGLVNPGILQ